ncbi:MAG TPA: TIGR04283 family arsenosugar biosynthesis glycosyltransferase [Mariprofundaceae bacterium]|nr:TIGR04283 family arsenosugar biosynthesis glycosyltransferase [Mariprofundaceae bacterium]
MPEALAIAVVVPVLDEAGELAARLPGLLCLEADELVVVDGGSHDGTLHILQQAGIRYVSGKPGRAHQMNAGVAATKSEVIVFLHIDTLITSSDLLHVKAAMQKPGIVGGRFDVRLTGKHPMFRVIETMINLRSRLSRISTGDQGIFVHRDVFERMGGFPDQPLMEDIEFSRRLKREGKIICLTQKLVNSSRRWEKHGLIRTILLMWKLRLLYRLGVPVERLATMYRPVR